MTKNEFNTLKAQLATQIYCAYPDMSIDESVENAFLILVNSEVQIDSE